MVKVISLSEEAYEKLKSKKGDNKSFSDVVIELVDKKPKKSIMDLFGVLKDDKESLKAFEDVINERKKIKLRPAKF
ncbi:antitoxin VapB family protein [Candidatus Woesearchaeota archaeon]|nr:antitoxin VapB family protein [Candidatus Woesearchaeota archaeon]